MVKKHRKIINIAFSIYPDYKSSEGIVNYNWQNVILNNSTKLVEISQKRYVDYFLNKTVVFKKENFLFRVAKNDFKVAHFCYKILNKIFKFLYGKRISIYVFLWQKKSFGVLKEFIDKDTVVWARVLPVISLSSVIKTYETEKFPLVVNVNDPVKAKSLTNRNNVKLTKDEILFSLTKDIAQAWTFPSSQLADTIAKKYTLDRKRCFVIPHASTPFKSLYRRNKGRTIKILYTGSFYKSAFTEEFRLALTKTQINPLFDSVQFTFVLSQYDTFSVKWLKETLPNVILKYRLDRTEVLSLIKTSDIMLVVDADTHKDLLKGKLVEAISYGIPVFAVTYKKSVMDMVVDEYGSFSSYQDVKNDIFFKLNNMIKDLNNKVWLSEFYIKRETVISNFSEENILNSTYDVSEFAFQRFNGNLNYKTKKELNWP